MTPETLRASDAGLHARGCAARWRTARGALRRRARARAKSRRHRGAAAARATARTRTSSLAAGSRRAPTPRGWCSATTSSVSSGRVAVQNNGFAIRRGLPFVLRTRTRRSVDERRRAPRRRAADVSQHTAGAPRLLSRTPRSRAAARDSLDSTRAELRRIWLARCRCSSAGSMRRQARTEPFARARGFQSRPAA